MANIRMEFVKIANSYFIFIYGKTNCLDKFPTFFRPKMPFNVSKLS